MSDPLQLLAAQAVNILKFFLGMVAPGEITSELRALLASLALDLGELSKAEQAELDAAVPPKVD